MTRPLPKVSDPAFRKKSSSLPRVEALAAGANVAAEDTAIGVVSVGSHLGVRIRCE